MSVTTIPTAGIADTAISTAKIANDAVDNTKLDLASNYAFTGTVTGAGKIVKSSRISDANGIINFNNGSSYADSGIDHNYTALSTSNTLIHYVNCIFSKTNAGGHGGGVTVYADDSAITEVNNSSGGLAQFHQDSATSVRSGNSFIYHQSSISSTNSIKYSLYVRGDSFSFRNLSGHPLIWTILEISA